MIDYKVSEMPYNRPDKDKVINKLNILGNKLDNSLDINEVLNILKEYCEEIKVLRTLYILAQIRFTQDTRVKEYIDEKNFWDETLPLFKVADTSFQNKIINSKFRCELEKHFPKVMFKSMELAISVLDERLVPLKIEEAKKVSEYTMLMSNLLIDYNGETLPPSGIMKYASYVDRSLREGAFVALGSKYMEVEDKISSIYDDLVKIRTKQGKLLGFDNYSKLGYANMNRTCYDKNDIKLFKENVKKYIVPLVCDIKNKVKKDLNLDSITFYDDAIYTKNSCDPYGTIEEKFDAAEKMYHEMNIEAGNLFTHMRKIEAFDVESRPGKWGGGYMEEIPLYKTPFILANFNGSMDDVATFTHEFGHSLNGHFNFKHEYEELYTLSMETAECHSMGMEFMTYPWMKYFFKDRLDDFYFNHIASSISFIPYGTIVDAFQQYVYDNPDVSPNDRIEYWKKLEKEFLPYMDNTNIPFYGEGRRWMRQAHIFEVPFYYIDYCLAQFVSFQFLSESLIDYDKALEKYLAFSKLGPTKSFIELLELSGLKSPFKEESFIEVTSSIKKLLKL